MNKVNRFEDLIIWKKGRELTKLVYTLSSTWKDYSLKDQIRRAAVSIVSNISEGFERGTKDEFIHFLYIARGSCGEVRSQLYVAFDQLYLSKSSFDQAYDLADHTNRMLAKFINGYKLKGHKGQKFSKAHDYKKEDFEKQLESYIPKKYQFPS